MLFLGIDQHARQLTASLRGQFGDVPPARQFSTRPAKASEFFDQSISTKPSSTNAWVA